MSQCSKSDLPRRKKTMLSVSNALSVNHTFLPRSKSTTLTDDLDKECDSPSQRKNSDSTGERSPGIVHSPKRQIKLTQSQKKALCASWRQMKQAGAAERMTEQIFQRLILAQPRAKDIFYKAAFLTIFTKSSSITTFRDHSRLLVDVFDDFVNGVRGNCEQLAMNNMQEIGVKHAFLRQSDLKPEIWERFGECAVDVVSAQDSVKCNADAARAWTTVIACMTDEMRHGFEKGSRKKSYTLERPKSAND